MTRTRMKAKPRCPVCLTEHTTRRRRFWHNSLWTSIDNTCWGVLRAQRVALLKERAAFLGEQARIHAENVEQWMKIVRAWDVVIAAADTGD